ncbi:transposase [Virgibacillus kekensis]|uniref:Transposase n=1 Tax=Virgibacillus kekensis TaxID=202261 RepID=A0ABV9DI96_9BACI
MPRNPRKRAHSGVYHVMLRGINKQIIFEDNQDRFRLLDTIQECKDRYGFNLYGYCLMDNHVHLLIREREESISRVIQWLSASYVYWYNKKYERSGHLYQDRFKSETVETASSFLRVLRYIHQNPLKAGLARDVFNCNWTSLNEYMGRGHLVDVDFGLQLFSSERKAAVRLFSEYMSETNDDEFLDNHSLVRVADADLATYMLELGIPSGNVLQQMDKVERNVVIRKMKQIDGVSLRQLARVTGISKSVLSRLR